MLNFLINSIYIYSIVLLMLVVLKVFFNQTLPFVCIILNLVIYSLVSFILTQNNLDVSILVLIVLISSIDLVFYIFFNTKKVFFNYLKLI